MNQYFFIKIFTIFKEKNVEDKFDVYENLNEIISVNV